jgi:hypothetical protein
MERHGERLIPARPEVPMPADPGTGSRALRWGVAAAIMQGLLHPLSR